MPLRDPRENQAGNPPDEDERGHVSGFTRIPSVLDRRGVACFLAAQALVRAVPRSLAQGVQDGVLVPMIEDADDADREHRDDARQDEPNRPTPAGVGGFRRSTPPHVAQCSAGLLNW
jgi:hypothetical protein